MLSCCDTKANYFLTELMVKAFDFIPYYYGCFSFQANQDLATMEKYGYLEMIKQLKGRVIKLKKSGNYLASLNMFDRQAILDVKEKFGSLTQQELIRYTYLKYPYFATKSVFSRRKPVMVASNHAGVRLNQQD